MQKMERLLRNFVKTIPVLAGYMQFVAINLILAGAGVVVTTVIHYWK